MQFPLQDNKWLISKKTYSYKLNLYLYEIGWISKKYTTGFFRGGGGGGAAPTTFHNARICLDQRSENPMRLPECLFGVSASADMITASGFWSHVHALFPIFSLNLHELCSRGGMHGCRFSAVLLLYGGGGGGWIDRSPPPPITKEPRINRHQWKGVSRITCKSCEECTMDVVMCTFII